jgi:hypothetical protein
LRSSAACWISFTSLNTWASLLRFLLRTRNRPGPWGLGLYNAFEPELLGYAVPSVRDVVMLCPGACCLRNLDNPGARGRWSKFLSLISWLFFLPMQKSRRLEASKPRSLKQGNIPY